MTININKKIINTNLQQTQPKNNKNLQKQINIS